MENLPLAVFYVLFLSLPPTRQGKPCQQWQAYPMRLLCTAMWWNLVETRTHPLSMSWLKTCHICTFIYFFITHFFPVATQPYSLLWQLSNLILFLAVLFSCPQWRNVWAPCRWEPRWWNFAVAPGGWCASSIWTNTSPASAGGHRARMKRPRVSVVFLYTVTRER